MKLQRLQSALKKTNGWATFLRVAYIGYVLLVVWIAAELIIETHAWVELSDINLFLRSALPVTLTILLLVMVINYPDLPRTVGGMLHLFIPAPLMLLNGFYGEGNMALIEVSIIHLAGVCVAYPFWLYRTFIVKAKGPLVGRIINFLVQIAFFSALFISLIAFVQQYIQYWDYEMGVGEVSLAAWIGSVFVVVFSIDQIVTYVKSALSE